MPEALILDASCLALGTLDPYDVARCLPIGGDQRTAGCQQVQCGYKHSLLDTMGGPEGTIDVLGVPVCVQEAAVRDPSDSGYQYQKWNAAWIASS